MVYIRSIKLLVNTRSLVRSLIDCCAKKSRVYPSALQKDEKNNNIPQLFWPPNKKIENKKNIPKYPLLSFFFFWHFEITPLFFWAGGNFSFPRFPPPFCWTPRPPWILRFLWNSWRSTKSAVRWRRLLCWCHGWWGDRWFKKDRWIGLGRLFFLKNVPGKPRNSYHFFLGNEQIAGFRGPSSWWKFNVATGVFPGYTQHPAAILWMSWLLFGGFKPYQVGSVKGVPDVAIFRGPETIFLPIQQKKRYRLRDPYFTSWFTVACFFPNGQSPN